VIGFGWPLPAPDRSPALVARQVSDAREIGARLAKFACESVPPDATHGNAPVSVQKSTQAIVN
jgi:hypothetical protein